MEEINVFLFKNQILSKIQYLEQLKFNSNDEFYNITNIQSQFLSTYIKLKSPKKVLEFGTSNGYSLLAIVLGILKNIEDFQTGKFDVNNNYNIFELSELHSILNSIQCVSVEIDENRFNFATQRVFNDINLPFVVDILNIDMFNFHSFTLEKNNYLNFDVIFVDCNQERYEEVLEYIIDNTLLSISGSIIFENVLSHKHSFNFISQIKNTQVSVKNFKFKNIEFDLIEYPIHNGFLELKRKT
ncbi:MAG: hypothetical protein LAT82_00295 [Nanoarchaeota archaeon]|nr:hypothetical protein [Nanoarchaeota archaeon]